MKTRICSRCHKRKKLTSFNKDSKPSAHGHQHYCKKCIKEVYNIRYQKNPKYYRVKGKEQRDRIREKLIAYLMAHPCKDCENKDIRVLEFDHLNPAEKEYDVSTMLHRFSWETILREIAKCDVVCANCHKIRTSERNGWFKENLTGGKEI